MDNYCKTCLHDGVDIGFCDKCYYNHILEERGIPPTEYEANSKPTTNYDRLRAMSVEEMAEFLETLCPSYKWTLALNGMTWLDWLKQEVADDGKSD